MKRIAVLATLALVAAPAAQAKGPVQLCGPGGCATFAAEGDGLQWLLSLPGGAPAPAPAPYYVIRFANAVGTPLGYWIPSARIVRYVGSGGIGTWSATDDSSLRTAAGTLPPFRVPKQMTVYVNGDNVKGDATYLRLYTLGTPASAPARVSWLPIWIMGSNSPWTDGFIDLRISRKGNYVFRNGLVYSIPEKIAQRVLRKLPLG